MKKFLIYTLALTLLCALTFTSCTEATTLPGTEAEETEGTASEAESTEKADTPSDSQQTEGGESAESGADTEAGTEGQSQSTSDSVTLPDTEESTALPDTEKPESSADTTLAKPETEKETEPVSDKLTYTVTVLDAEGKGIKSVIVKIMQSGKQVKMNVTNSKGVYSVELDKGNYTVELTFTQNADSYKYDDSDMTLSASKTSLTVTMMSKPTESTLLFAPSLKSEEKCDHTAYEVYEGTSYVELNAGDRTYFTFTPESGGMYSVKCTAGGAQVYAGYYGSSFHVLSACSCDECDGKVHDECIILFRNTSVGATLVIGVDGGNVTEGYLTVKREGDVPYDPYIDMAYTSYTLDPSVTEFSLPEGTSLTYFSITDPSLSAVYNEEDGFYHLNSKDGPVLYLQILKASPYIDSIKEMCEVSGFNAYIYDESGQLIRKDSYNSLFTGSSDGKGYGDYCDQTLGVYPLNMQLAEVMKNRGEHLGWWDSSSPNFLFEVIKASLVQENAWLFACCYVAE